jgi:hypothetical protein
MCNKFQNRANTIILVGIITIFGLSFVTLSGLNIKNTNFLDNQTLLSKAGSIFNPPDEGKPDPGNTAGYS